MPNTSVIREKQEGWSSCREEEEEEEKEEEEEEEKEEEEEEEGCFLMCMLQTIYKCKVAAWSSLNQDKVFYIFLYRIYSSIGIICFPKIGF